MKKRRSGDSAKRDEEGMGMREGKQTGREAEE